MKKINKTICHTPMIQQYLSLKSHYPDMLLFYRMGDFYELFYEDAKKISHLLKITLTKKGYSGGKIIPMSGIPCNFVDSYLVKLIKLGESIAICEQIGGICPNTNLLQRKVVKVITPGTVTDDIFLKDDQDNLLSSIWMQNNIFGYATLNICSGSFNIVEYKNFNDILSVLEKDNPKELLYPENFIYYYDIKSRRGLRKRSVSEFEFFKSWKQLSLQFSNINLFQLGFCKVYIAVCAAGCLLQYVKNTHYYMLPHIKSIKINNIRDHITINGSTYRNLEIIKNISGGTKNTLCSVLDHTSTSMGSRMLKRWLNSPERNFNVIKNRQNSISGLRKIYIILQAELCNISDLERITSRIALRTASPKDFISLKKTFIQLPIIKKILLNINVSHIRKLCFSIKEFKKLLNLLERAINICPSDSIQDGGVISSGYNDELDTLRLIKTDGYQYLKKLEIKLKDILGIESLKIRSNRIIGYYIQVSKRHCQLVPSHYSKCQTLKNCERYFFKELKDYESNILVAQEKIINLEKKLYTEIFDIFSTELDSLYSNASILAEIDVLTNLAERSVTMNYTCPKLYDYPFISLIDSRHPVIESVLQNSFVSNSVLLSETNRMIIITGANMGGKSTYMRQIALIVIMTWIGSYVPAKIAKIGNFNKIFIRVGSADDLSMGKSTFMVEMTELASILNNADKNSLVLIDEIGRGTSTYDGLSLAWACAEYLVQVIKSITLFSTHYFELTLLAEKFKEIKNIYFEVIEHNNLIQFTYMVKSGSTKKSHGLAVAQLSGLPNYVIRQAQVKLKELEYSSQICNNRNYFKKIRNMLFQKNLKENILCVIKNIEPDLLSPRESLEIIYLLKDYILSDKK